MKNDSSTFVIRANWVATMEGPLLPEAAVAVSKGKIVAVGPYTAIRRQFPHVAVEELPKPAILMPGLVNAHVHLELSALTRAERPARFVDWLKRLIPRSPPDPDAVCQFVTRGVEVGKSQCLQFGVTSVGDISRQSALTRKLLKAGPLRVVSFGEVQAMAQRREFLEERIATAIDTTHESELVRPAISPHSPYSVEVEGFRRCLAAARENQFPIATHLAETAEETQFLTNHTGDFRELWTWLEAWDEHVPTFTGGPIRMAKSCGLLEYPALLAHVNYCDDDELALLADGQASVVYCPRTHEYFGHPPHRWRDMLEAGINVAVGTDSCASSPDLNLVDDLRLIHRSSPDIPAISLWEMATLRSARAIGLEAETGSIAPLKNADFVAFEVSGDDPLTEILQRRELPIGVWTSGRRV